MKKNIRYSVPDLQPGTIIDDLQIATYATAS